MSNNNKCGKWSWNNGVGILEIFSRGSHLWFRWLVWKGDGRYREEFKIGDWEPTEEQGYKRLYEFKDYLKTL